MAGQKRKRSGGTSRRVKSRKTPTGGKGKWKRAASISIKRMSYTGAWTWATTSTNDFYRYQTVNMGSFNNFAELAAVFDEYKVNAVKYTYRPRYDSVSQAETCLVNCHYVVDPSFTATVSGAFGTSTLNTFLEHGPKTVVCNKPFSIYYKPKVFKTIGGVSNGELASPGWMRTDETTVPLRGHAMFLQPINMNASPNFVMDVFVTYYVSFRNLK